MLVLAIKQNKNYLIISLVKTTVKVCITIKIMEGYQIYITLSSFSPLFFVFFFLKQNFSV